MHVTDHVTAQRSFNVETRGQGNISLDDNINALQDLSMKTETGNITVGKTITARRGSVAMTTGIGNITVGEDVYAGEDVNMTVGKGNISIEKTVTAEQGNLDIRTKGGKNIIIAQHGEIDSGQDATLIATNGDLFVTDSVKAKRNVYAITQGTGNVVLDDKLTINGSLVAETNTGDIHLVGDANIGRDLRLKTEVGDISLDNVNAQGDVNISITDSGSVKGNNIISGGTTRVELTNGDLFLNLAEGKAVLLKMENNTEASKVNQVLAEARGGTSPDVTLTGNFIQIGSMAAKGGTSVFELSAMGAGNQKLIAGNFYIGSLRSSNGTHSRISDPIMAMSMWMKETWLWMMC